MSSHDQIEELPAKSPAASFDRLVWLMAVTAGLVVANNYYAQPLLGEMARDLSVTEGQIGWVAILTQVGYALGLLLLLPLGDKLERRGLISVLLVASAAAMLAFAAAPSFRPVAALGFAIGFFSIVPQILPPIASHLAKPGEAARAVGKVMGGLLLGIVLSRFAGGMIGSVLGWRAVYVIAAGLMFVLLWLLRRSLPVISPPFHGSYASLIASLGAVARRHAELRWLSGIAALQFAAFSLFWTTIAFHLYALPEQYPASVASLFALIGAGGVLAAMATGSLMERFRFTSLLMASGCLMLVAFLAFLVPADTLIWMVIGVVVLDMGMQISHVSSMARILAIDPGARSRLNTVYMAIRFAGGGLGTFVGGLAWTRYSWPGVCAAGIMLCVLALIGALLLRLLYEGGNLGSGA